MFPFIFLFFYYFTVAETQTDKATINALNGKWQLDKRNSESMIDLLAFIGIDRIKRNIINSLDIIDIINITDEGFHLIRDTQRSHLDQIYKLNIYESIHNILLGHINQLVTYKNRNLIVKMILDNNATFIVTRRLAYPNKNKLIYINNYTLPSGVFKTCTSYFRIVNNNV